MKREYISGREKTDGRKRQWYRGTRGGNHIYVHIYTHTYMIDFTRIKGGFICKSVVNGGRKYD